MTKQRTSFIISYEKNKEKKNKIEIEIRRQLVWQPTSHGFFSFCFLACQ